MSATKTVNRLQLSSPESVQIIENHSLNKCDFIGAPLHTSTFKYYLSDFNIHTRRHSYPRRSYYPRRHNYYSRRQYHY